jgi:hypothetical protein
MINLPHESNYFCNFSAENFVELVYGWFSIFFCKILIDFSKSFIWSYLDNSRDISKFNYLISKPNYLTSFLITTSYLYNYLTLFLIPISPLSLPFQIIMCIFISMMFILIQNKFDIDIINDELFIII